MKLLVAVVCTGDLTLLDPRLLHNHFDFFSYFFPLFVV